MDIRSERYHASLRCPGCDKAVHPGAARFNTQGELEVTCDGCHSAIAAFEVAPEEPMWDGCCDD